MERTGLPLANAKATGKSADAAILPWITSLPAQMGVLVSLGMVSAMLHSYIKLHLGIPGHKAIFWLAPILIAKRIVRIREAGTVSSSAAALGMCALHGFSIRWPMFLTWGSFWLVGPALDAFAWLINRRSSSLFSRAGFIFAIMAGVIGNYAHFVLKLMFGIYRPHAGGFVLPLLTYFGFGVAAGAVAYGLVRPFARRKMPNRKRDRTNAFSLVEMLVVMVVIAVLCGLLLSALASPE